MDSRKLSVSFLNRISVNKHNKNIIIFLLFLIVSYMIYTGADVPNSLVIQRVQIKGNDACTIIQNTGIYNQNTTSGNLSALYWPCEINSYCFTAGLSSACIIDGKLGMYACTYRGEIVPGCVQNNQFKTNNDFKIYLVKSTDNEATNPDYANWYKMIPYGAPYIDVNNNCAFDAGIDKPGFPGASQTVFICLTDADSTEHTSGEGFGGGVTNPLLKAEVRLTVWTYSDYPFNTTQMFRYQIINKNNKSWDSLYFALFSEPDIRTSQIFTYDYLGCDTNRHLCFAYGSDTAKVSYGYRILRGPVNKATGDTIFMSSFVWERADYGCEWEVPGQPRAAYNYMKGFKSDGTSYLDPTRPLGNNRYLKTKYIYSGDPETNTGWTPRRGRIANCGGADSGYIIPVYPGGANTLMGIGAGNLSVMPGDTQLIIFSQTLAAGIDTANAVTNLKNITDKINYVYQIDIKKYAEQFCTNISIQIPNDYSLSQNYPNPFNSVTHIQFAIPRISDVRLEIFDVLGKQVELLVNSEYNPGFYEIAFDAQNFASGIYFYRLVIVDKTVNSVKVYSRIYKMALIK